MTRRGVSDERVAFLAKPFSSDSLVGAVREAVRGNEGEGNEGMSG